MNWYGVVEEEEEADAVLTCCVLCNNRRIEAGGTRSVLIGEGKEEGREKNKVPEKIMKWVGVIGRTQKEVGIFQQFFQDTLD